MSPYAENNYFVRQIHEQGKAESKAEGKAEAVRMVLEVKFDLLPDWAYERIAAAKTAQLDRWIKKLATAATLEAVLGRPAYSSSVYATPENHYFVRQIHEQGKTEGRAEGKAEGKAEAVRMVLEGHFGPLPDWASERIATAKTAQLDRSIKKLASAATLEAVLGRRA